MFSCSHAMCVPFAGGWLQGTDGCKWVQILHNRPAFMRSNGLGDHDNLDGVLFCSFLNEHEPRFICMEWTHLLFEVFGLNSKQMLLLNKIQLWTEANVAH